MGPSTTRPVILGAGEVAAPAPSPAAMPAPWGAAFAAPAPGQPRSVGPELDAGPGRSARSNGIEHSRLCQAQEIHVVRETQGFAIEAVVASTRVRVASYMRMEEARPQRHRPEDRPGRW